MKTFIGVGNGNVDTAVESATRGLGNPNAILFIAAYDSIEHVATRLYQRYPNTPTIGTLGTKIVNGTESDNSVVVLGLYEDVKVACGVIEKLSSCPIASIAKLEENVRAVQPGREDTVCIEYCTNHEERLVTTLNACFEKKGIGLIGGTVFGVPDGKEAIVAYNGRIYTDACVYAIIRNLSGKVRVYKENIYQKSSDISHFATKVDVDKRSLIELDGKSAAEVYSREVGVPVNKIVDNVFQNPMGRVVGEQVFISSMKELLGRGEIANYKRINKNDCIYFLELGDYKTTESETRDRIRNDASRISLVISVDCIYRYLLYQNEKFFSNYISDMAKLGPHIGVVGGGEQFNNQHVNQTMVCAVFE